MKLNVCFLHLMWNNLIYIKKILKNHIYLFVFQLNSELKECKAIRKKFLKEVIESARTELEELWVKCCVSEFEKELFEAYQADIYTEDILTLHEMEIDRLKKFYEDYK